MTSRTCLRGPGCFQWDPGAWFGSQFGGTLWMLVGAGLFVPVTPLVAMVWLACFAVANLVGVWLWSRRDRLAPYPALQALLLTCGLCALVAIVTLDRAGPVGVFSAGATGYLALLVFPALSVLFHWRERMARAV